MKTLDSATMQVEGIGVYGDDGGGVLTLMAAQSFVDLKGSFMSFSVIIINNNPMCIGRAKTPRIDSCSLAVCSK